MVVVSQEALLERLLALESEQSKLRDEREQYRRLYLDALEQVRLLTLGILQKRERFEPVPGQMTLDLMGMTMGEEAAPVRPEDKSRVRPHDRTKPGGKRLPLPESLPRVDVEALPPEVLQRGLDAFEELAPEISEALERRRSSMVAVRTIRRRFIAKDDEVGAVEARDGESSTPILIAPPPTRLLPKSLLGPGLLADTVIRRFRDSLPAHRLERIYAREGFELPRSTTCAAHMRLGGLLEPLVGAMLDDARRAPLICVDATTVKVQAPGRCKQGYIWILIAPERHTVFIYTRRHNQAAVRSVVGPFDGLIVADAHAVYDHLYEDAKAIEYACWSHARRYFFKALASAPEQANEALVMIRDLFAIEAKIRDATRPMKEKARDVESRPIVKAFWAWLREQLDGGKVLTDSPLDRAITYAANQREALEVFLDDGRVPMHNNASERGLRGHAVGRKNWLFFGTDEGGETNAVLSTLLASCEMHRLDAFEYLVVLQTLLPHWPGDKVLDLVPAYYRQTVAKVEVQEMLASDRYRAIALSRGPP